MLEIFDISGVLLHISDMPSGPMLLYNKEGKIELNSLTVNQRFTLSKCISLAGSVSGPPLVTFKVHVNNVCSIV